jgi:hypothetical protein
MKMIGELLGCLDPTLITTSPLPEAVNVPSKKSHAVSEPLSERKFVLHQKTCI